VKKSVSWFDKLLNANAVVQFEFAQISETRRIPRMRSE
jgi:hypothetical protein